MKNLLIKLCLFNFFISFSCISTAQNHDIDSLKKVLLTEKEDTNKVNTLIELNWLFAYNGNYDALLQCANTTLLLSEKINFTKGSAYAYGFIGTTYYKQNNYAESLKNLYKALNLFEKIHDQAFVGITLVIIGHNYKYLNNHSEALKKYFSAIEVYKELKDTVGLLEPFMNIGAIYFSEEKYSEALQQYSSAEKMVRQLPDNISPDYFGYCYEHIGEIYQREGEIAYKKGNKVVAADNFVKAGKKYSDAFDAYWRLQKKEGIAACYSHLANIYRNQKKYLAANIYLKKGLQLSTEINDKDEMKNDYHELAMLDSILGNYKEALGYYERYILFRDSLVNEKNTQQSVQLKLQYEFDKKESIARAEQEKKDAESKRVKNLQYFIIGGLGIVVLVVLLIASMQWRNNKHKQKANLLLQQQKEKVESTLQELKSTQSQLIQSEKMASLGELTAGIAHEIQNPLNFVNNFSEVNKELLVEMKDEMNKGNIDDANAIANDVIDNEEKINHHGKRADAIVKGMLQHSRSSTGAKEPTDINALADEYLRLSYHGLRAKDHSFNATMKTDFDESLSADEAGIGKINIIPQDIGRVLLNLYNNAFYAVAEKKKVLPDYEPIISVSTKGSLSFGEGRGEVLIKVSDNGNGIPQKAIDKIFQPFFTTKPTGQGTGLGLSLSYDIIKAHGGEIKVETKESEGSEFIIQLPII